jgi:hypothetical protein
MCVREGDKLSLIDIHSEKLCLLELEKPTRHFKVMNGWLNSNDS